MDVRLQNERRFLVYRRRRLGDRPHLCLLRAARGRRHRNHFRRRAHLSGLDAFLAHDPGPQSQRVLHGADRDPLADQARRGSAEEVRPVVAAHSGHRRRADQPGSVDVVPRNRRPETLPYRRHLVANRNRRPHDYAAPRRRQHETGFVHAAAARHHGGDRRRSGPRRRKGQRRLSRDQAAVAVDDTHDLGRSGALQEILLPGGLQRQVLPRRRRRQSRSRWLFLDHGAHRRRAECLGTSTGHDGNRIRTGRQPIGGGSRGGRPSR